MWGVQFCDASELEPKLRPVTISPTHPPLQKNNSADSKEYLMVDCPDFENRGNYYYIP